MTKREALSLLDTAPRSELVEIDDNTVLRVRGLGSRMIKELLIRFPDLQGVVMGSGINARMLIALGPEIVGAICAAATGELGNPDVEERAADLPVETQLDILEAVGRCTFSKGFGPFVDRVVAIAAQLSAQDGRVSDMNSPPPSSPSVEQPIPPSGN